MITRYDVDPCDIWECSGGDYVLYSDYCDRIEALTLELKAVRQCLATRQAQLNEALDGLERLAAKLAEKVGEE